MDWSRRNSSGAVAHPNNQQYLAQSTSSTMPNMPNHSASVQSNSYNSTQIGQHNVLLKELLGAKSEEEVLRIQLSALSNQSGQQTMQTSQGTSSSSFSPRSKTASTSFPTQLLDYPNFFLQTLLQAQSSSLTQQQAQQQVALAQQQAALAQQQAQVAALTQQQAQSAALAQQQAQSAALAQQQAQSAALAQQQAQSAALAQQQAQPLQRFDTSAYNTREVQQSLQATQSGGYSNRRSQHIMNSNIARRNSQNGQKYQSMSKANSQNSVTNGTSGPYAGSYKAVNEKNVPVSTSNYQNVQTIPNQMGLSYQPASHPNPLQLRRNINVQRQIMPNSSSGFPNNSSNVLSSITVGQLPLSHPQSNTNAPNIVNVSVNQMFSNPNQNFVALNVQQSVQSYTVPQDQHSVPPPQHSVPPPQHSVPPPQNPVPPPQHPVPLPQNSVAPPAYNANVTQDQSINIQNLALFLNVYQNVKQKYLLLNQKNTLLRKKIQSTSQGNPSSCPVKPPLISSLLDWTGPTNDPVGRQEVSQNSPVKNQPLADTTHGVQTPILYENSSSSHAYPISYTGFDNSQINHVSTANSSGQVIASETIRGQDPQKSSMVSIQANNQYHSGGNSSNGNLSQDGFLIPSVPSLPQTATTTSESSNLVPTRYTSNHYAKNSLSPNTREAIQATLSLWKSDPPSSAQNKSEHSKPKQDMVNKTLETIRYLEEMVSSPVSEPNVVTLTQKSELSAPNVSKGIKPHVAIVSPLVQIKDLVNEINQHPKVLPHGEDVANDVFKDNEYFNEFLLPQESVDATKNNQGDVQPSSMVSSLPCNVDQNSTETVDENLQISGICTLVEGNSLYDSSIAMMFESSLQTEPGSLLAKTDLENDCIPQCSQEDVICCTSQPSGSHTTESVAVKSESQENIEDCVSMGDDQKGASDYGLDTQSGQNLSSSVFNAESNAVSDQLSELLTEFPFGIKNYMSKNKLENADVSLGKLTQKPEPLKSPVPFFYGDGEKSIKGIESAVDTLTKEMETQKTKLSEIKTEPTFEVPIDEVAPEQLEDDGFEISDSPDGNIHITLMDQEQIPELFPEDSPEPVMRSEESVVDSFAKDSQAPVLDVAASSKNEKADDESASDKELFCCLFSWLTHTNGNAPKCNCKLTELGESEELIANFSQPSSAIKTEPSTDGLDPSRDGGKPLTGGLDSSPDTCKTQLDRKNEEIHPPAMKRSKIEPVETTWKRKPVNCSPQEEIKEKLESSEKTYVDDQSQKELEKGEPVLQSNSHLGESKRKDSKDPFPGCKSKDVDGPQKLEKLIIKTDFLKNRHLLKMKRKYKEMKSSRAEEGAGSVHKTKKYTDLGKSAKTLNLDQSVGGKAKNEECKSPTSKAQPPEKSMHKLESSSRSDKSHPRNQTSSTGKRKERVKYRSESHFEKVKRVPSVQEYLERKRELCSKRYGPTEDQRVEPADERHRVLEKSSVDKSGTNLLAKLLRPSTSTEINVKTNKHQSGDRHKAHRGRSKNIGTNEYVHKKHRGPSSSHGKGSSVNKEEKKIDSNKEKIYLAPCGDSRRASYEGISLTKLQIRHSPVKPGYFERRTSVDSNVYSKHSKSETKNKEAPKMLEFKLCPEFVTSSPTSQEKKEPKASKEKRTVEGIKSKKEAWCSGGPPKKRRIDGSSEDQGHHSPQSTSSFKWTQKNSSRPVQDTQTTFNVFKQRYQEQRSKSLDGSL
ncbi:retroelement silencing factor 1 [Leptodactylus fuscus]|uniref:retroelement silencing factor 1 n=1 Tax=Leptodactylus fuscus TaxID=238119 RepID=UPI003F4E61CD